VKPKDFKKLRLYNLKARKEAIEIAIKDLEYDLLN